MTAAWASCGLTVAAAAALRPSRHSSASGRQTRARLYAKILLDSRHTQVVKVVSEPIPKRMFDEWTMGFLAPTREELAAIPGLNDFFGAAGSFHAIDSGRAKRLLLAFAEGRWRQKVSGV